MPTDPNHGYNVPSQGATDWHTPLNQNFNDLAVDVELRGNGAPSTVLGNSGVNGQKYIDTSTGEVYLSDGNSWTKEFEQLQSAGRYISTNSGTFNFSGPAEWDNDGDTATNTASGTDSTVAGGVRNEANSSSATVGGGEDNLASGAWSTVAGGDDNEATADETTVSGGFDNQAISDEATVSGGAHNTASGNHSTVPGGEENTASGNHSFAAGRWAEASNNGSFVWSDSSGTTFSSTGADQFLVEAAGGMGVGTTSPSEQLDVSGNINSSGDIFATIVEASNLMRTGGMVLTGPINANPTFQVYTDGSLNMYLEGQTANDEAGNILFGAIPNITNTTADYGATISGGGLGGGAGEANEVYDNFGTIGGGKNNTAGTSDGTPTNAEFATVSGGTSNTASATEATVGGGDSNEASGAESFVGGGFTNEATNHNATVAGGNQNDATGDKSTVGGGFTNTASGGYATVPGGDNNTAGGSHSFAAGDSANADFDGSFVWADTASGSVSDTGTDQFIVEANGGMGVGTDSPSSQLDVNGDMNVSGTLRKDAVTKVYYGSLTSISSSTWTTLPFGSVTVDETGQWDTTNYQYQIPETGHYEILLSLGFVGSFSTATLIETRIRTDAGSTLAQWDQTIGSSNHADYWGQTFTTIITTQQSNISAGTLIEFQISQDSGSQKDMSYSDSGNTASIRYLGESPP